MATGQKPSQRGAARPTATDRWPGASAEDATRPCVGVHSTGSAPSNRPGHEQGVRQHLLKGRNNARGDSRTAQQAVQSRGSRVIASQWPWCAAQLNAGRQGASRLQQGSATGLPPCHHEGRGRGVPAGRAGRPRRGGVGAAAGAHSLPLDCSRRRIAARVHSGNQLEEARGPPPGSRSQACMTWLRCGVRAAHLTGHSRDGHFWC